MTVTRDMAYSRAPENSYEVRALFLMFSGFLLNSDYSLIDYIWRIQSGFLLVHPADVCDQMIEQVSGKSIATVSRFDVSDLLRGGPD